MSDLTEPGVFVIFGGTGDLARRKLLPALGRLAATGRIHEGLRVLGVSRDRQHDDDSWRQLARAAIAGGRAAPADLIDRIVERFSYQSIGDGAEADFRALGARIEQIEREQGSAGNRVFYLALPPSALAPTVAGLSACGLNSSAGWTRAVVEKPFGRDLRSATELSAAVRGAFEERQIYRIDHYLGKDAVQNLLVFRFANALFEAAWNRDRVSAVQISVAEDVGVGSRAGYYDRTGALRDMVQNHLTQLLALVAMEVPAAYDARSIRFEKSKVLQSVAPLLPSAVVCGRYTAGVVGDAPVPGYLEEEGVAPDSRTETFAALKVGVDNWRWQGVPFYLRTGKRLPRRETHIAVRFRNAPVCLFESLGSCLTTPDVLLLRLQPNEGFSLHIDVKAPGAPLDLRRIPLSFSYRELFDELPEAYETLLLDVLQGDQTLFVSSDEIAGAWELYDPLLATPRPIYGYAAGTWGPAEAEHLAIPEREIWRGTG